MAILLKLILTCIETVLGLPTRGHRVSDASRTRKSLVGSVATCRGARMLRLGFHATQSLLVESSFSIVFMSRRLMHWVCLTSTSLWYVR